MAIAQEPSRAGIVADARRRDSGETRLFFLAIAGSLAKTLNKHGRDRPRVLRCSGFQAQAEGFGVGTLAGVGGGGGVTGVVISSAGLGGFGVVAGTGLGATGGAASDGVAVGVIEVVLGYCDEAP